MTPREERGLIIAALTKLNRKDGNWFVPSQSDAEKNYRVDPVKQTCTCPDHKETGFKCKHQFAVEFTIKRECNADGSVTDTKEMKFTEKVTYEQNWPAYNKAQGREKDRIQEMLADLCSELEEPVRPSHKGGHPPHSIRDIIFAMTYKVYSTFSGRRFMTDMRHAVEKGHMSKPMPFPKISKYMMNPNFTPILKELIAKSAAPLKAIETDFAIDSSGFGTSKFERWYDHKYGRDSMRSVWVKVHLCSGVKTHVVTAVRILDKDSGDCPQFTPLVKETAKTFTIGEVSADKAYSSLENFETVAGFGGKAFIAFRSNTTGAVGGLFEKMFHYFKFQTTEFMQHYHKRSNVESTFSAIKRKFGDSIRAKDEVSMVNETLCKILCHNLCVLNHEECELGIDAMFTKAEPKMLPATLQLIGA